MPMNGDGYLSEWDAEQACYGLPDHAAVLFVLSDFREFAGPAAGWLGRRMAGCDYTFEALPTAWAAARQFEAAVRRAEAQFVTVEVDFVSRGGV